MVLLLAFRRVHDGGRGNEVLREATTQEVAVVKTMSVDDPPGGFVAAMLNETLSGLDRFDSLLHTRAFTGRATSSERAIMLHVEVKFYILDVGVNVHVKD